jgi:hypothetical protein
MAANWTLCAHTQLTTPFFFVAEGFGSSGARSLRAPMRV